jgi:hypothetical protein
MPNDLGDRERAVLRARYGFNGVLSEVVAECVEAEALDSETDRLGA